jgi:hypothetical protein
MFPAIQSRFRLHRYSFISSLIVSIVACILLRSEPMSAQGQPAPSSGHNMTCDQIEEFLHQAKIGTQREVPKGITLPKRATLEYNNLLHDASIQTVDESKTSYQTQRGTELNFRDSWKYNVAGYEVAKILELNMLPPYVERKVGGKTGSLSWWVNDAMMEVDRFKKKMEPPDTDSWNKQMYAVRVFHELIYDTDPNLTNILISKDWQIWIIDCSRAFRVNKTIREPKNLVQCDRKLLAKLRTLDKGVSREKLSHWLTNAEIDGLVSRAATIVQFFDKEVTAKGESSVLYDFPRSEQACGTGL